MNDNIQESYFNILTKDEALKLYREGKTELVLLHEDDNGESVIENETEIIDAQEQIGVAKSYEEQVKAFRDRVELWRDSIRQVQTCLNTHNAKIGGHYDCSTDLQDVIEEMEYLGVC